MLKCHIVRDLLPTYVDGLTAAETNREIAEHVQGCAECGKILQQMQAPLQEPETIGKNKEIDYLKKIKANTAKKILAILVCIAVLATFFSYFFILGSPVKSEDMHYIYEQLAIKDGEFMVHFKLKNNKELRMLTQYVFENNEAGIAQLKKVLLKPYEVWPSPIHEGKEFTYGYSSGAQETDISTGENKQMPNAEKPENGLNLQVQTDDAVQIIIKFADKDVVLEPW